MEPANTGYRSIEFTLKNETRQNLFMSEGVFKHGRWDSSEPTLVKADETCVFKVCSKDGALIGVEGFVVWKGGNDLTQFRLEFMKPKGGADTIVTASSGDEGTYKATVEGDKKGYHSQLTVSYTKRG